MGIRDQILKLLGVGGPLPEETPGEDTTSAEAIQQAEQDNEYMPLDMIDPQTRQSYEWLQNELSVKNKRQVNLDLYNQMDDEFPEVSTGLDIYADNVTQLGLNESSIIKIVSKNEELIKFLEEKRDTLKLDDRIWSLARQIAKEGEVFEEVIANTSNEIVRLKTLPSRYVLRNEDKYGLLNTDEAFVQINKDNMKVDAVFHSWEVIHYRMLRNNDEKYGTSILHPTRRVYKQLRLVEDSMLIARLTRANTRFVHFVDVGNLPPNKAEEHLNKVKSKYRKRKIIDPSTGRLREDTNPLTVEEDIFIATRDGSKADVKQLYGDINIGNLDDVTMFRNKLYAGMKVPKSYLGIDDTAGGKATLTNQDIQFARSVRRIQISIRSGFKQLFDTCIRVEKPALSDQDYRIVLPGVKTIDEMREWEMKRIQAEVARLYASELYIDPIYVLENVLGYSEDQAKRIYLGPPDATGEKVTAQKASNGQPAMGAPTVQATPAGGMSQNRATAFRASADKKFSRAANEAAFTIKNHLKEAFGPDYLRHVREVFDWQLADILDADESLQ